MFLNVEQDVNLAWQSCSGLANSKIIAQKNVKNPGKSCFAVRKEWVNVSLRIFTHFAASSALTGYIYIRARHFRFFYIFTNKK